MLQEKLQKIQMYRDDGQKAKNPILALKTHFTFQLETRTVVRTNARTNEQTHTHTYQQCQCDALVLVFGLWGGLEFGSARETVRPAGLLHTGVLEPLSQ